MLGCEVADMLILNTLEYGALGFGVDVVNLEMGFTSAISAAIIFSPLLVVEEDGCGGGGGGESCDTNLLWHLGIRCGFYI